MAWLIGIIAALVIYIVQLAAVLLLEHRRPAVMTAWLFISFLFPIIGFIAYIILGSHFTRRRRLDAFKEETMHTAIRRSTQAAGVPDMEHTELRNQEKLFEMLTALSLFPITCKNKTTVLTNGEATFGAILEQLEQAKHHIHLDYYTIRDDGIGMRFLDALTSKAKAGIEVRVIYDGIGSLHLSDSYLAALHAAGVQTCCFLPPRAAIFNRRLNFRNHRKIVVVDGEVGFIGGINIGDEYLGKEPKLGFWRDTHLRLEGDSVYFLQELFMHDWAFAAKEKLEGQSYMPISTCSGTERVQIVSSRPGRQQQQIMEVMFAAITSAKHRIFLTTPYFIPDSGLLLAIRTAALSGVDVRLIIPGAADSRLVLLASLSYIEPLLDAGVQVYRYKKGFVHAKVMIIDELLATVGTANVDMRSLYSNFELNAVLFEKRAIERLVEDFEKDLKDSNQLDSERFKKRPRSQRAKESLANMLSPLL